MEFLPDFESFLEIWIALYGRSEGYSVAGICNQFWRADRQHSIARRAIFDVAPSRFPIQVKPLLRLLRVMTGSGFLDTDPWYIADTSQDHVLSEDRDLCAGSFVYQYLLKLSSYTKVVAISVYWSTRSLREANRAFWGVIHLHHPDKGTNPLRGTRNLCRRRWFQPTTQRASKSLAPCGRNTLDSPSFTHSCTYYGPSNVGGATGYSQGIISAPLLQPSKNSHRTHTRLLGGSSIVVYAVDRHSQLLPWSQALCKIQLKAEKGRPTRCFPSPVWP